MKKVVCRVKVRNAFGLHARPAAMIARLLHQSKSQATLTYDEKIVDARSVMSILMLAIKKNSLITLTVEGDDADEVLVQLVGIFENQFGEQSY